MKIASCLLCILATSAFAQQTSNPGKAESFFGKKSSAVKSAPSTPNLDQEAIIKELEKLRQTRQQTLHTQLNNAYQKISAAAADNGAAMDIYMRAMQRHFQGQNQDAKQFAEWKKKEADRVRSHGFQQGLHYYMVYLGMTLQNSAGATNAAQLPALLNYIKQLQGEGKLPPEADEFLKKPVTDNTILRNLDLPLTPKDNWVMTPGNIDEMYQRIILPMLREKKDPAAIEYWNQKIEQEVQDATSIKRTVDQEHFNNDRKPSLLWSRAMEFCQIGQTTRGMNEMLAVIRAYPLHPSAEEWAKELESHLISKDENL